MAPMESEDKLNMFKEAIRCFNGTVDFAKLAEDMGVVNAEAMRKRFKRAFEQDGGEPLEMTGNQIGGGTVGNTPKKTSNTSRGPAKKRKIDEVKDDNGKNGAANDISGQESDNNDTSTRKKSKTPKTPKSPKSPAAITTPKTAKARKTAKAPKTPEAKKSVEATESAEPGENADAASKDGNNEEKAAATVVEIVKDEQQNLEEIQEV